LLGYALRANTTYAVSDVKSFSFKLQTGLCGTLRYDHHWLS
jgi:hypothetical protein